MLKIWVIVVLGSAVLIVPMVGWAIIFGPWLARQSLPIVILVAWFGAILLVGAVMVSVSLIGVY